MAKRDSAMQAENHRRDKSKTIRVSLVPALCIGLFTRGKWPLGTVAMIGAFLEVVTGCITGKRACEPMDWRTVMPLGDSIGFAAGFDKSGDGKLMSDPGMGYPGDAATPR